jgi:hypothetical protein
MDQAANTPDKLPRLLNSALAVDAMMLGGWKRVEDLPEELARSEAWRAFIKTATARRSEAALTSRLSTGRRPA